MRCLPAFLARFFAAVLLPFCVSAQLAQPDESPLVIKALNAVLPDTSVGGVMFDPAGNSFHGTNGVFVQRGAMVLTADNAWGNTRTGDLEAEGHVHLETGGTLWVGDHVKYNYITHHLETGEFRAGAYPDFVSAPDLTGETAAKVARGTNTYQTEGVYNATNVFLTGDDFSDPSIRLHASRAKIIPGKYVEMWDMVVWIKGVPTFYFPYYRRNLGKRANNFTFTPGYRSTDGAFLLNTYSWFLDGKDDVDGAVHLDYRERRGVGGGPDLNLNMGRWGDATFKYYYIDDAHPYTSTNGLPNLNNIPEHRERFHATYIAAPYTNVDVRAVVDYQSDPLIAHDFFSSSYLLNPQPSTYLEVNPYSRNWSLDGEASPELNNFYSQVDRLPDVRLTGFRQQIDESPFYYESQSSVGWYRRYTAETNGLNPYLTGGLQDFYASPTNYSAGRFDTYHQITLPWTFFDWLNVDPRMGGRLTYYGSETGPADPTGQTVRGVFNTGVDTSFKLSQLWAGVSNAFFQVDGLRHVIEPSASYVYVPRPNVTPDHVPQFDYDSPSLLLLPVTYPDYNNIDSIDSQNVIRFGLRNTLQTKRDGEIQNLVDWNLMLDWNITPDRATNAPNLGSPGPQKTFDDLYSDFVFRPRTWLAFESQIREDINSDRLNLAFHQVTIEPSERWSWGIGYWYLADNFPAYNTPGANLISSTMFYRLSDNWGFRATHYLLEPSTHLQQQFYTIYRDFRSWVGAITFRAMDNGVGKEDYTVAFTFTFKFSPRTRLGSDTIRPYELVGE